MFAEPPDFDRFELARLVRAEWDRSVSSLEYAPVGFGTHHYHVQTVENGELFVNVDDLGAKAGITAAGQTPLHALSQALETATALREAGLEFVHGPIRSADGRTVIPMGHDYAVSVYPFIHGSSNPHGAYPSAALRRQVLVAIGRMHGASDAVPQGNVRRDTLEIPLRQEFLACLDDLSPTWSGGPFADPARELVREHQQAIRRAFGQYDDLVAVVRGDADRWVITHGEPHAGNVMQTPDGAIKLIDWDTTAVGPPERDLWMIEPESDAELEAYISAGGAGAPNPAGMRLYRLSWALAEVSGYTVGFREPHVDDANTRTAWGGLTSYVDELAAY